MHIFDSLKIQKQKQGMNDARADNSAKQHSNYNHPDNESMKSWVLEQRIRQLELEVLRQDNKLNNLSDKMIDLRIDNSNSFCFCIFKECSTSRMSFSSLIAYALLVDNSFLSADISV
jgi:hypothetical protein